jgi:hypothetical protein
MTSLSKHFIATDESATGQQSFRQVTFLFFVIHIQQHSILFRAPYIDFTVPTEYSPTHLYIGTHFFLFSKSLFVMYAQFALGAYI